MTMSRYEAFGSINNTDFCMYIKTRARKCREDSTVMADNDLCEGLNEDMEFCQTGHIEGRAKEIESTITEENKLMGHDRENDERINQKNDVQK